MTKLNHKASLIIYGTILILGSCSRENKPLVEATELKFFRRILSNCDTISATCRYHIGRNWNAISKQFPESKRIVSVAPQSQATVSMPFGGFIKSTNLLPGNAITKGRPCCHWNQDFVDIQQNYLEQKTSLYSLKQNIFVIQTCTKMMCIQKDVQLVTVEYKNFWQW